MTPHRTALVVNGTEHEFLVEPRETLAEILRERCGLTGTPVSCEQGVCGVCTVLVDGEPARSCLRLGVQSDGCEVRTVESLAAADGALSPLQQAFIDRRALQCGFCTAGFLMLGTWLCRQGPLEEDDLVTTLASNHCRCTGYRGILDAVRTVANGGST